MFTRPDTIITFAGLHRDDLHTTAARERQAATVAAPALPWRQLAIRAVGFLTVICSAHG